MKHHTIETPLTPFCTATITQTRLCAGLTTTYILGTQWKKKSFLVGYNHDPEAESETASRLSSSCQGVQDSQKRMSHSTQQLAFIHQA